MTDRPIIMSGPMVRAIRDGRKTQTRRVLNPQPWLWTDRVRQAGPNWIGVAGEGLEELLRVPCAPGDRLWVRETWAPLQVGDGAALIAYRGTWNIDGIEDGRGWRRGAMSERAANSARTAYLPPRRWISPLHMPRRFSRLTLHVTDVRVQRLCEISEDDAQAEGVRPIPGQPDPPGGHRIAFRDLWDSLNAKRGHGWDRNRWVAAITFRPKWRNIDEARP